MAVTIMLGNAVKCICKTSSNYGRIGEVVYVGSEEIEVRYDDGELGKGKFKYYQLITSCEEISPKKSIMCSIIEFASNLGLSANEKLLRKYALKNECGYTESAYDLVMAKLVADNEAYLIEVATAKQKEDNKNK